MSRGWDLVASATHLKRPTVYTYMCACICVCTDAHMCAYVRTPVCMHVCCVPVCTCVRVCFHVHVCVCLCVPVHVFKVGPLIRYVGAEGSLVEGGVGSCWLNPAVVV